MINCENKLPKLRLHRLHSMYVHFCGKYYKTRSRSKVFREMNSTVTFSVITLIWREKDINFVFTKFFLVRVKVHNFQIFISVLRTLFSRKNCWFSPSNGLVYLSRLQCCQLLKTKYGQFFKNSWPPWPTPKLWPFIAFLCDNIFIIFKTIS